MGTCCSTLEPSRAADPSSPTTQSTIAVPQGARPPAPVLRNLPVQYISLVKVTVCCIRNAGEAQLPSSSRTQPLTAVLYHRNGNNEWVQQYCSVLEQLPSGLEASWHVQFKLLESQDFRVLITAADGQQQLTGEAAFRLSELVCLPGSCVRKRLPSRLGVRQVVVTAKEDLAPEAAVSFRAQAALPQYSAQQGRVPVLQVSREDSQEHWVPLASAEGMRGQGPGVWMWHEVTTTAMHLCHGSLTRRLRLELLPHSSSPTHGTLRKPSSLKSRSLGRNSSSGSRSSKSDLQLTPRRQDEQQQLLLGTCVTTLLEMLQSRKHSLALAPPATSFMAEDGGDHEGWPDGNSHAAAPQLELLDVRLERKPTLLDYLAGGGTIKLLAALDFSCSNEPQNSSGSMHQAAPGPVSACEQVVCAFASALQDYGKGQQMTLWAFGSSLAGGSLVALNGNPFSPDVKGAAGVSGPYRQACSWMPMTGQPKLADVLAQASALATPFTPGGPAQQYTVLLVVLAGLPEDVGQLREAARAATHLPLLVLVLGLGAADFSTLQEALGGAEPLPNIRFCHMRLAGTPPHSGSNGASSSPRGAPMPLSRADIPSLPQSLLSDLPGRVMQALHAAGGAPLPPRQAPVQSLSSTSRSAGRSPQGSSVLSSFGRSGDWHDYRE